MADIPAAAAAASFFTAGPRRSPCKPCSRCSTIIVECLALRERAFLSTSHMREAGRWANVHFRSRLSIGSQGLSPAEGVKVVVPLGALVEKDRASVDKVVRLTELVRVTRIVEQHGRRAVGQLAPATLVHPAHLLVELRTDRHHRPAERVRSVSMAAASAWRQHQHGGSISMAAASAWRQHQHGGSISMAAAPAWRQRQHGGSISMAAAPAWRQASGSVWMSVRRPAAAGGVGLGGAGSQAA